LADEIADLPAESAVIRVVRDYMSLRVCPERSYGIA